MCVLITSLMRMVQVCTIPAQVQLLPLRGEPWLPSMDEGEKRGRLSSHDTQSHTENQFQKT